MAWARGRSSPVTFPRHFCQAGTALDFLCGLRRSRANFTTRTDGVMNLGGIPIGRSWKEVASLFSPFSVSRIAHWFLFQQRRLVASALGLFLAATEGKVAANVCIHMKDAFRM